MISFFTNVHNKLVEFNKDEKVSYERKNFYIVMICTFPILLFVGGVFLVGKSDLSLSTFCFVSAAYVLFSSIIASFTKQELRFSYIYSILFNFFIIPTMFFISEGILFGMVLFFALGIILTVVLLGRQKAVFFIISTELFFDVLLVVYAYFHPEKIYIGLSSLDETRAISLAFFLVSSAVIFLFIYQNYNHSIIRQNIEKDNVAIKKAENTKGRFLANMTHEIRTPMNAIIGMTDLILREDLSKNTREYADTIKTASGQLLQIINNILEFSKLDSGRAEAINYEYSFSELIKELISKVSSEYLKEDITLHVFLSKEIPDRLFGDDVRIKQVLRYLLFSPLTRSKNGTVKLDITCDYDYEQCRIKLNFRIASTGRGLTEEEIVAIYNAYSNYDSRQKTDYNRTGLEISICQKILDMMDGELKIESIEGIGNAIEFSFMNYVVNDKPIASVDDLENVSVLIFIGDKSKELIWQKLIEEVEIPATYVKSVHAFRRAIETRSFTSIYIPQHMYGELSGCLIDYNCEDKTFIVVNDEDKGIGDFGKCKILRHPVHLFNFLDSINGMYDPELFTNTMENVVIKYPHSRVLCVDDSFVNLKVLENLLKEYEINPQKCSSGSEALEVLENNEFDLMFIDYKMPVMDGAELVSRIRKMGGHNSSIPIICATADFGPAVKEKLEKEGFDDYIAKPINLFYLETILSNYIPKDLHVERREVKEVESDNNAIVQKAKEENPLEFDASVGVSNLGGSEDAYLSVLLAYYKEGLQKIIDVNDELNSGDISLYTTNVHALKSSSATVGCIGISPLFKALEFAGKENDLEYINNNNAKTLEYFGEVLGKVKEYLDSKGIATEETEESQVDDREIVEMDFDLLNELSSCILSMNLRRAEEIIDLLVSNNYGSELNKTVKMIKESYDGFEYMEIKKIIEEIL